MKEIVDKSSHFKQVCQLLVSLIVAIIHPHLRKPRQIQMMLTILWPFALSGHVTSFL